MLEYFFFQKRIRHQICTHFSTSFFSLEKSAMIKANTPIITKILKAVFKLNMKSGETSAVISTLPINWLKIRIKIVRLKV